MSWAKGISARMLRETSQNADGLHSLRNLEVETLLHNCLTECIQVCKGAGTQVCILFTDPLNIHTQSVLISRGLLFTESESAPEHQPLTLKGLHLGKAYQACISASPNQP